MTSTPLISWRHLVAMQEGVGDLCADRARREGRAEDGAEQVADASDERLRDHRIELKFGNTLQ